MRTTIVYRALAAALLLTATAAAQSVFESHGDLGVTPKPGAFEYDAAKSEYRITGGGATIWGTQDGLHFVWKRLSGDFTLTADIQFLGTGGAPHRKAVLMARQDLTAGSVYADVARHGDGSTALQFRPTPGAVTQEVMSSVTAPVRIRLERRGNRFTAAAGKPGEELTSFGPQTVELSGPVYVGIGVCAHDANALQTVVFSNVRLEQRPAPAAPEPSACASQTWDWREAVLEAEKASHLPSRDRS